MDPITAAIIGAAAIAGAGISATSAHKTNKQNIAMQNATNQTAIELANTAHQREVADLQKAGLNPVLSAGGSGAQTPTLGTAQAQTEMPDLASTMIGAANAVANQTTAKATETTANAGAKQAESQANLNNVNAELQPQLAKAQIAADFANAGSAKATADYTKMMTDIDANLKKAETENIGAQKEFTEANTYRTKNISKGEQSRLWTQALTGGLVNIAGTATGAIGAANTARMMNMSRVPIGFKY